MSSGVNTPMCRGLIVLLGTFCAAVHVSNAAERELRVCSDPNNLPFSNQAGEGFENKLAQLVASELDADLSYTWWAQRRGFIRNTLKAGRCDLIIGVPAGYELVDTTRPYYRSAYIFVYQKSRGLELSSISDPQLRELDIGVHLTGDDGVNPPPAHALGQQGIVDNVTGYMIYGDYAKPSPASQLIEAVAQDKVDVAAVWGPIGGYFAQQSPADLMTVPIKNTAEFDDLNFEYSIAMGVRKGDTDFKRELDSVLKLNREKIHSLLRDYGVPLMEEHPG